VFTTIKLRNFLYADFYITNWGSAWWMVSLCWLFPGRLRDRWASPWSPPCGMRHCSAGVPIGSTFRLWSGARRWSWGLSKSMRGGRCARLAETGLGAALEFRRPPIEAAPATLPARDGPCADGRAGRLRCCWQLAPPIDVPSARPEANHIRWRWFYNDGRARVWFCLAVCDDRSVGHRRCASKRPPSRWAVYSRTTSQEPNAGGALSIRRALMCAASDFEAMGAGRRLRLYGCLLSTKLSWGGPYVESTSRQLKEDATIANADCSAASHKGACGKTGSPGMFASAANDSHDPLALSSGAIWRAWAPTRPAEQVRLVSSQRPGEARVRCRLTSAAERNPYRGPRRPRHPSMGLRHQLQYRESVQRLCSEQV